ncbi:MAG: hypothetical protein CO156_02310 [Candidatus Pacebacteria bacterium CG_4_9_14_3_um_filter_40_12]|nr:MAG: hypothetical protein COU64_01490 [Candidatus Pacebacteria bacterium CG10_big_fil_rev_8_21_14_0_10_40_26]PIZ78178.1 MAG: hypothetical protein COY01_05340 [Candidatus Pacebacteria bacterium CG_4_10_14_0_2_um_filter_40_20]PJA69150.1 MAG: hypothetical protein CO156_02310 [Candidatus Pacebacteria bacterium CG_4_9_14_3_um_filter_40_12]PJC41717.1 MAG: hypothetical protein CO041_03295 [Candidatus Pacebacteria bacterium CG_4_9_14_0_2_um_filter_40_15]
MKKRFWVVFLCIFVAGILSRLYNIERPLVDRHNFRQTDTWVISQKLASGEASFFAPTFYHAPDPANTGRYFLAEVPFYEAIIGFVSTVSTGLVAVRFVNILLACGIGVIVFLTGRLLFKSDLPGAVGAVAMQFFPGFSFWGRAVTPDILSLFGFSLSVYAAVKAKTNSKWLLVMSLGFGLAILSKPSYVLFGLLLFVALFGEHLQQLVKVLIGTRKNKQVATFLVQAVLALGIPLLLLLLWRLWIATFPDSVRSDPDFLTLMHGHKGYFPFWKETQWPITFGTERLFGELLTPLGGFFASVGLFVSVKKNSRFSSTVLVTWVLSCILLTALLSWGTRTHDYYALPWVLPAALLFGVGASSFFDLVRTLYKQSGVAQFFGMLLLVLDILMGTWFGPISWWKYIQAYASFGSYELWNESMQSEYTGIQSMIEKDAKVLTILEEYSPFVLNTLERDGNVLGFRFFESCPSWQSFSLRISDYQKFEPKDYILVDSRNYPGRMCDIDPYIDHFWSRYPVVYEGDIFTVFRVIEPEFVIKGTENTLWLELWNLEKDTQLEVGGIPGMDSSVLFSPEWKSIGAERGFVAGPIDVSDWVSFKIFWENPDIQLEAPGWVINQDNWVVRE